MSAATPVQIDGVGVAAAGLDWLLLPGLDGRRAEIKLLGRGVNAAWQYVWSVKSKADEYVSFVSKGETKKRPIAAGALIRAAIEEETYLSLVSVDSDQLWLFGVKDGMPVNRMDRVGDAADLQGSISDFLTSLTDRASAPIFTDRPDVFAPLPYDLDVRPFSLEILAHSLKKGAGKKARFARHTSVPVGGVVAALLLAGLVGGYMVYDEQATADARRNAAKIRAHEVAKRKVELASAVGSAINQGLPVKSAVAAYLDAMDDVPMHLGAWRLTKTVECAGPACTLTFAADRFATWEGYLRAKPAHWPTPSFDTNIKQVTQVIPVTLPVMKNREAADLPQRDALRFELGNLAQLAGEIGVAITLGNNAAHVAGKGQPEDSWVPVRSTFTVSGPLVMLEGIASRLPPAAGIASMQFSLGAPSKFEIKGETYANP